MKQQCRLLVPSRINLCDNGVCAGWRARWGRRRSPTTCRRATPGCSCSGRPLGATLVSLPLSAMVCLPEATVGVVAAVCIMLRREQNLQAAIQLAALKRARCESHCALPL